MVIVLIRAWWRWFTFVSSLFDRMFLGFGFVAVFDTFRFFVFGIFRIAGRTVAWWWTAAAAAATRTTGRRRGRWRWTVTVWWARWTENRIRFALKLIWFYFDILSIQNKETRIEIIHFFIARGKTIYLFFRFRFERFSSRFLSLDLFVRDNNSRSFCRSSSFRKPVSGVK